MVELNNNISSTELKEQISTFGENLIVVDVRTREEYNGGHIKNSVNLPVEEINIDKIYELVDNIHNNNTVHVILVCRSGFRSGNYMNISKTEPTYDKDANVIIKNLTLGMQEWQHLGYETVK